MAEYNLAVIGGDGVGPEVIAEGRKVLEALGSSGGPSFRFTEFPVGQRLLSGDRPPHARRRA